MIDNEVLLYYSYRSIIEAQPQLIINSNFTSYLLFPRASSAADLLWRCSSSSGRSTWFAVASRRPLSSRPCGDAMRPTSIPYRWLRGTSTGWRCPVRQLRMYCLNIDWSFVGRNIWMKLKYLLGVYYRREVQRVLYSIDKTLTQSQTLAHWHKHTQTLFALVFITKEKLVYELAS